MPNKKAAITAKTMINPAMIQVMSKAATM